IAVIPGDGIGTEVTRQAVKLLRLFATEARLPLELVEWDLGSERYLRTGSAITTEEMEDLRANYDAIFLGALGDPRVPDNSHIRAILLGLRFHLDLYVNLRPVLLFDASLSPLRDVEPEDVDIVIVRENTEGVYAGLGGNFRRGTPDEVAIEEDIHTRKGVERIVRAAFEHARASGRHKVTLADKANAMPHVGDLWRRVFAEVAAEYPDIEHHAMYIDALALDLVLHPARYDVIVTSNLFGDILSDLAAALAGGQRAPGAPRDVRAGPRLCAGHRRHRAGQSAGRHSDRGDDAGPSRLRAGGGAGGGSGAPFHRRAPDHAGPRRLPHHGRGRGLDLRGGPGNLSTAPV